MLGIRHEKHGYYKKLPFSLVAGLERSRHNLSKEQNWHENLEIQLITEGTGMVLLNGERYNVKKDDIVVVNSNFLHYTFTDSRLVYTCIIISNEWCRQMNIDYDSLRFSPLITSRKLKSLISMLETVCLNEDDVLRVARSNEILLQIMIDIVENYSALENITSVRSKYFEMVISAIDFIHKNFNQKLSLNQISHAIFVDKYTLCKEFKKYTGQTIFEYINQYRSIKATEYMAEGYTVSKTAEMCGFANLSFFTKTFKKYVGSTPSVYRKNARLK